MTQTRYQLNELIHKSTIPQFNGFTLSQQSTTKIRQCYALAKDYHQHQTDRSGQNYLTHHLTAVALLASGDKHCIETPGQYRTVCVAFLHDIIEDTPMTLELLNKLISDTRIVQSVALLTRDASQSYMDYIDQVANSGDNSAILVKIADLLDHLTNDSAKDLPESLKNRYTKALNRLTQHAC